jgi:aminoglycoside phosphotransferase (APT) family kinase protein
VAPLDPDVLARATTRGLGRPVRVEALQRLTGGASRETWAFDAIDDTGRRRLVLRRDPSSLVGQTDRGTEYGVLAAAHEAGVAVPPPRFLLDPADDLGAGFVMDHVAGETIARKILRDDEYRLARDGLVADAARALAAIHAVPTATVPPLAVLGAAEQVDQYRSLLDGFGEPHPAFELGLRRLAEQAPPPPAQPALVHGDFRLGNFVVDSEGLRAVLDWELAHLGDPAEDLGWLCVRAWRFGHGGVVAGIGSVDELLAGYAAAGGAALDAETVRYWVALGTVKWGVICIAQAFTHLHGHVRSVELATIGRRVAETEWDLLTLLDGGW